jgi:hypothetical protein
MIDKCCKHRKLRCYLNKPKITALKKGGKLKKTGSLRMNGQNKEAVNTFNYLVSQWKAQEVGTNRK